MNIEEYRIREEMIQKCLFMNNNGLNQGTSGNISVLFQDRMLITPSGTPYEAMTPEMIASVDMNSETGAFTGPLKPSSEWRFHRYLLRDKENVSAIVHAHSTYCTTLSIARKSIPACHYMIAAFGGNNIRCSQYARYGTEELAQHAIKALEDRMGCLLANHGMIALGENLDKAMWRAVELETIARQYYLSLQIEGGPYILNQSQIQETLESFATYGLQDANPACC